METQKNKPNDEIVWKHGAKLLATFDSTGMNQKQVLSFLMQQSQKKIDDLGIELNLATTLNNTVHYKTPFNAIKMILRYVWWIDKAGTYDYMKIHQKRALTAQELIEFLIQEDPNAAVMVGDLNSAVPVINEPTAMYINNNTQFFKDSFFRNNKNKIQPVVVIDIPQCDRIPVKLNKTPT